MFAVERLERIEASGSTAADEASAYAARARRLGLPFVSTVEVGDGAPSDLSAIAEARIAKSASGRTFIAPDENAIADILHWLARNPVMRGRLRVATPTAIRAALIKAAEPTLLRNAIGGLAGRYPHLSARRVATGAQVVGGLVLITAVAACAVLAPFATLAALDLLGAVFFFGVSALRFEDRPHPRQLREAYAAFAAAGPDLASLQAGLVIDNGDRGWLPLLFSIEYAALFDGLLPALASLGMPLPLGGTSNHFRRAALENVGGWDPYNVTEDADLGLRLARFGYRCATLDMATLENAPTRLSPWIRQRTRWFKGWMQTWLVHTRDPVRLWRELGPRGTLGFTLVGTGLIVSSLVYPLHLMTIVVALTNPMNLWGDHGVIAAMLVGANLFNLVAGYLAMAMLSDRALRLRGRGDEARGLMLLPLYWLLMSFASYRAIFDLIVRPHYWAKTPHAAAE